MVTEIGKHIYNQSADGLWVNLYVSSRVITHIGNNEITPQQTSNYPWEGNISFSVKSVKPKELSIHVPIPGCCDHWSLRVNSTPHHPTLSKGYAEIHRTWSNGDTIELSLPMGAQRLRANPQVLDDRGKIALRHGPLIYCLEQPDMSTPVDQIVLPLQSTEGD